MFSCSKRYVREALALGESKEEDHDDKRQDIRNQRDHDEELGQVSRRPGSLEIAASVEEGEATDEQGKDVALDERARKKSPRVHERQLRYQRQIGDDNVGILAPLSISNRGAEQGLGEERDEQHPCDGGDVYARRHRGGM